MSDEADTVLVLRCAAPDGTSFGGFRWPAEGPVEAPDWRDDWKCGGGLHGWLWGAGSLSASDHHDDPEAVWQVVEVLAADVRDLGGKVKFPRGRVVYSGAREGAVARVMSSAPDPGRVVYGIATAGYGGTATAGERGTATAGDGGTATAGYRGTATAGYGGTATAGAGGTATAGDGGTATAGDGGTATAGERGTATAGYGGTATAGDEGEIRVRWWDCNSSRYRTEVGYVGEGGILPGVPYRCEGGILVRAK